MGISPEKANLGSRNIAMYKLDQLLGTGVVPKTERASYSDPSKEISQAATVMDLLHGKEMGEMIRGERKRAEALAKDNRPSNKHREQNPLRKPEIQKQFSNLQLLDVIAGQADRHFNNIMAITDKTTGEVVGIRAIDNDFCFGLTTEADQFNTDFIYQRKMPDFVDKGTAEHILTIDEKDVRDTLAGLLNDAEIEQTVKRFKTVKEYLERLFALDDYFAQKETDPNESAFERTAREKQQKQIEEMAAEREGYIVSEWNNKTYNKQMQLGDKKRGGRYKGGEETKFYGGMLGGEDLAKTQKANSYFYDSAMRMENALDKIPGLIGRQRR
jgi:hypothetical protein